MIGCVKRVADLAGLFETRQMRAYDEDFDLLCYPDCQGEIVCFDYSYYEGAKYEKVTINCQTGYIHSGNIGFNQFSAAVQALAMLVESCSNPYFCCDNRFGLKEIRWLGYVLGGQFTLKLRKSLWDFYEQYMLNNGDDMKSSAMDIVNSYEGDGADFDDINTIVYVHDVINDEYINECVQNKEPVDKSYGFWVRSMARFLWLAKRDSMKSEKELLSHYIKLLHNVSSIRNDIKANKDVSPVKELFAVVAPPITVKLIATIYGLDFWQLWRDHKESIGLTSSIFYDGSTEYKTEDEVNNLDPITTEEFFGVAPEDRLYWWKEDGDVIISDKTQRWLDQMSEQHRSHIETMADEFSAIDWHQRLVKLLGKHKDSIKMFEHLYCEFLNTFHLKEFRAWIEMLEVLAESELSECSWLIAVLANHALRKEVFGV